MVVPTGLAAATEVRVQVAVENGTLRVNIEDNGCGFDPSATRPEGTACAICAGDSRTWAAASHWIAALEKGPECRWPFP